LATPMPVLAAFFLFTSLASAGLPMLNGFVGEFLILAGTFQRHSAWAACAAAGVIVSAVYLLWAYQRVFLGAVTVERNRALSDTDRREQFILVALAFMMLWMGIGSADFTRRSESSTRNVFELMKRPGAYNAGTTASPKIAAKGTR
jgi:NADH-quinone oxidoreductase subunit M